MAPSFVCMSFVFPYLTFGQTLKAVMYNQHSVALDKANPHGRANSSIHASSWGPHIHHGHCVQPALFREERDTPSGGKSPGEAEL